MKRNMRVLLSSAVMMLMLSGFAVAQMGATSAAGTSADKQEMMAKLEKLSAALQLSPEQKQKMAPIMMEEGQKMKGIKSNTTLGPMQKAMQLKQVGADMDAKIQPILSPQQFQKFQEIQQQEREQMIEKMRSGQ
jgi:periplasmic protein CpxP/Spy